MCYQTGSVYAGETLSWTLGADPNATADTSQECDQAQAPTTAFDLTRFTALYWGIDPANTSFAYCVAQSPGTGLAGCTGPVQSSGPMTYDASASNPAAGTLVYQGTTDANDLLTVHLPGAATNATTIGTFANGAVSAAAIGQVWAVSGSTPPTITMTYSKDGGTLPTGNCTCRTTVSISGGFYYVDLPPSATVVPSVNPPANHTAVTFSATNVADPYSADDGAAPLSYAWDLSGGSSYVSGTSTSASQSWGPGDHTVALQVTDADGISARETYEWTITNQLPTGSIAIQSPGSDPPGNHTTTTFVISNLTDPDQGTDGSCAAPTVAWDLTGGTSYSGATGANVGSFGPGQHTVAALLTDCDGGTTRVTKTFTITDQPPTGSISPSPNPPKSGQLETFTATNVTDPDQGNDGNCAAPTYGWDMSGGTNYAQFANTNATGTFGPGSYTIALGITDCDGMTTRVTYHFTIAPAAALKLVPRQTLAGALSKGFKASLTGNEGFASQLALTLTSAKSKAGKPIVITGSLWTGKPTLTKAGTVGFTMTLTAAAKSKLSQAKTATFSLKGTAKDKAGHTVPVKLSFTMT